MQGNTADAFKPTFLNGLMYFSTYKTILNFWKKLWACQPFNGVDAVYKGYNDVLMDGCLDTRASKLWLW